MAISGGAALNESKVLHFPQKSCAKYGTLVVFHEWQPGPVLQIINRLKNAGDKLIHDHYERCIVGKLEEIAMLETEQLKTAHTLFVPGKYASADVLKDLKNIKNAEIYSFDRLEIGAVFYIRNANESSNDKVHTEQGPSNEVIAKFERWKELGHQKMIVGAAKSNEEFASVACGRGRDAPLLYTAFGIQTIDRKYVLDIENLQGPYTCAPWGGTYVAMPHMKSAMSNER